MDLFFIVIGATGLFQGLPEKLLFLFLFNLSASNAPFQLTSFKLIWPKTTHFNVDERQVANICVDNTKLMGRTTLKFVLVAVGGTHGTGLVKQSMSFGRVLVAHHCQIDVGIC
jgi:hypothetical protein